MIGERDAIEQRLSSSIHQVIELVCKEYDNDDLSFVAFQCVCLASKFRNSLSSLIV